MRRRVISKVLVVAMMGMLGLSPAMSSVAATPVQASTNTNTQSETQTQIPKADVMDVDFSDGTAKDQSETANAFKVVGSPVIKDSTELHKKMAVFNGSSAYQYTFNDAKYQKITDQVTIECMFKYNSIPSGESDIFSNQQSGGLGLGLDGGKLTFFAHVGGGYKQPTADIQAGQWVHAIGVVDGTSVKLYVNGELKKEIKANGGVHYTSTQAARSFLIGADSSASGGAEYFAKGNVSFARLYSKALSEDQIKALSEKAFEGATMDEVGASKVNLSLVGTDTAAESGQMNLNVHANTEDTSKVDKITFDVNYDPAFVSYAGVQHKMSGVTINNDTEGKLSITVNKTLSIDDVKEFSTTRIGKLNFRTKNVKGNQKAEFTTSNFHAYAGETEVTNQAKTNDADKVVTIYDTDAMDLNGDGVIGAGDVALARTKAQKEAIAQKAAIYPYKHAVVLTMDGGGQVWNPDAIYYTTSNSTLPKKTNDETIMAKRKNTYAVDLFNKEFATSYTAQSVKPSISAQNYSSMIHGVPWEDVSSEYQVNNTSAGQRYYADYGKSEAKYPSVFKTLQKAYPQREQAAFAEWTPILNGIIEADAAVIGKESASKQSFYDVAKYIKSSEFDKTSMVYMQSDWMDHVGHSTGYYNDKYWSELAQYDDFYKSVMDALKESGHADDTLIVSNADHGGSGTNHGSMDPSNMDIFIGIGGQTVDSGKKLSGGTNADISPIVLNALRVDQPASMTGKVFDQSAFLSQEQMSKKQRDVEKVVFERQGKQAEIKLNNKKQETRSADMVIDLAGNKVSKVDVPDGATLVRNEEKDGKQYITISYEKQPEQMAVVSFADQTNEKTKIDEIMLGTEDGKEIYSDLENKQGEVKTPQQDQNQPVKQPTTATITQPAKQPTTAQKIKTNSVKLVKTIISKLKRLSSTKLKVQLKKVKGAKGYLVKYSTNKNFKKARYVYTKSVNVTLKKLNKNKKYYIKAKAYATNTKGKKVFGPYSKVKSKSLKK